MNKSICWAGCGHGLNLVFLHLTDALRWATDTDIASWSLETHETASGNPRKALPVNTKGFIRIPILKSEPIMTIQTTSAPLKAQDSMKLTSYLNLQLCCDCHTTQSTAVIDLWKNQVLATWKPLFSQKIWPQLQNRLYLISFEKPSSHKRLLCSHWKSNLCVIPLLSSKSVWGFFIFPLCTANIWIVSILNA